MFETELSYFIAHQNELVAKYRGQVLVLRGEQVVGAFPDALDAYVAATRSYDLGTFMLQPCEPGPAAYTISLAPTPDEEARH